MLTDKEKKSLYINPVYIENIPIIKIMYRPPKKIFMIWNHSQKNNILPSSSIVSCC